MQTCRVLIVDDHPLMRRAMADLVRGETDLEVCGVAGDVAEAIQLIASLGPDLVLVDIALPDGNGIDLIEQVKARHEGVKMLVATMYDESLYAERALRAGAMGYVNKQEPPEVLLGAIRQVIAGQVYLSPRMAARLLHGMVAGRNGGRDPMECLSNRELEVFGLIGEGMTTKQIATRLQLSPKTIETHREKLKKKLNLKNGAELSCRAVQWVLQQR